MHASYAFGPGRALLVRTLTMFAVAAALPVTGCNCSGGGGTLVILRPDDGATVSQMDDVDDGASGVQVEVEIGSMGLRGEAVELFRASTVEEALESEPIGTGTIGDDTRAIVEVTLEMGAQDLLACTPGCEDASDPITVTLTDACAAITFVTPTPPSGGGNLTLGPMADTAGEACGETFGTNVLVSTDAGSGQEARLFVNGEPTESSTIDGMLAQFDNVTLGNRGDTANMLEVEVQTEGGLTCRESFPGQIFVDCEGASCDLTAPDPGRVYLNQDDDVSADPGFQGTFEASTDSSGVDQPIRLEIDGMEIGSEDPVAIGDGGTATFTGVDLEEGSHVVQAVCRDDAGNITRSSIGEWTVDITPCDISINTPADGELFTDMDDVDPETDGIQIDSDGTIGGADCSAVRVGVCDGSLTDAALSMGDWMATPTLPTSTGTHSFCAEVEDEAGNIGEASIDVDVRTEAPELQIVTPSSGDGFNRDGTDERIADLDDTTGQCEAEFVVNCTDVGLEVEILREGTDTPLTGGTATCEEDAGVDAPFEGVATFPMVSIPTRNSGDSLSLVARQSVDSLTGLSPSISVTSDCEAPSLSVNEPTCGDVLRPSMDDSDPGSAGFQHDVSIINNNSPKPAVELEIRESDTGDLVSSATSSTPSGGLTTEFPDADFNMGGELDIIACATDNAGNTGGDPACTGGAPACTVTVADLPVLDITSHSDGDVITETGVDGCAAGEIRVEATTDAADGSDATAQVGSGAVATSTASGGAIDVCVEVADGRDLDLVVTVDDPDMGMASATVTVDIDTMPPTDPIDDLAATVVDRRGGEVEFDWTAVDDAGGFTLEDYELRCADAPITDESEWDAARVVDMMTSPASGGTSETELVDAFRPGVGEHCTLRGVDPAGELTPIGNSAEIDIAFLEQEVTDSSGTSIQFGQAVVPVGDVNGDGVDDILIGAPTLFSGESGEARAYLYFGSSSGLSDSPDVAIVGTHSSFGLAGAGLGDFNGDGRPDFAVSARGTGGGQGTVYVFYGRAESDPWPSTIDLTAGACEADICFVATDGSGVVTFGWSVAAADFDGDGLSDLAIGAAFRNRAYVLLGSSGFMDGETVDVPVSDTIPADSGPDGFFVNAPSDTDLLGAATANVGGIGGGTEHDLAIGAPGSAADPIDGKVFTLAGRSFPGGATGLQQIEAADLALMDSGAPGLYGERLATSDHDGDGRLDLIVHTSTNRGDVHVYPRDSSGFLPASRAQYLNDLSNRSDDRFGRFPALADSPILGSLGDIDADGVSEVFLGSDERGTEAGSGDLFFGAATISARDRSAADLVVQPDPIDSPAPRVAAFLGDVDGDGWPDMAVGDPTADSTTGRLIILY